MKNCKIITFDNEEFTPAALGALACGDVPNFLVASVPGGIEAQEKRGQMQQAVMETLPIKGTCGEDRKRFESLGFVFGECADNLFINVQFPKGWKKIPTDHSMWSDIIDDKGRKRGAIFYKAAFYDMDAFCSLNRRYSSSTQPIDGWNGNRRGGKYIGVVKDGDKIIFKTEPTSSEPNSQAQRAQFLVWYEEKDKKDEEAKKWLAKNFPKYDDVLAYWDDSPKKAKVAKTKKKKK